MEIQMFSFKLQPDAYYSIPQHLLNSLERYLNHGIMPGGFLTAVLENNLCEAFGRADIHNSAILKEIVGYVYNHLPSESWGSREKVREWQAKAFAASAEDNAA
jgi:hypothetical protein